MQFVDNDNHLRAYEICNAILYDIRIRIKI